MDAVYPSSASALARGRRVRRANPRQRHRTTPVTFAEIQEVDEENEETRLEERRSCGGEVGGEVRGETGEARRRRPDVLEERFGRQFVEFRRRRARTDREVLRERDPDSPPPTATQTQTPTPAVTLRAGSEPALSDHSTLTDT